jgi:hypothetical protein
VILLSYISIMVGKIQLVKRKELSLTQKLTQAEPLIIVSYLAILSHFRARSSS